MKKTLLRTVLPTLAVTLLAIASERETHADVRLPAFFNDHMVLQQQMPIKVWGWADAGETVTVSIGDQSATAKADDDGKWKVELPPRGASKTPIALTVKGNNAIEINDVLIGEVWLCSGQSNMEWPVLRSSNAKEEIAAGNYPLIRHVKFPHRKSLTPTRDITGEWRICSPETVGGFSGAGYFMARTLHQELDVPIGLINSSWGGTRVEPWTPPEGFAQVEELDNIHQQIVNQTKFESHQDPTMLFNAMIRPIVGYPMRGAIWYQGESNHTEGMLYYHKKRALIEGWRKLWGQGDFPFYFVQIAPFQYGKEDPTILPRFWEAQAAVQQLPNCQMVVINDIATLDDIHPPNKQDVGSRLAGLALKHDYGRDEIVAHSPSMESMEIDGNAITIRFRDTGGQLNTRDGKKPSHFEVIGDVASGYKPAKARVDGNTVILKSDEVKAPVAFRFAWHKLAEPNLTGATGLPVGAFRGGEEPQK
jgi:sialate O-acetylesterase